MIVGPTVPFKGGAALHTTELARRLDSEGSEVTLLSWRRQYPVRLYPGVLEPDEPEDIAFRNTFRILSWNRPDSWLRVGFRMRKQKSNVVLIGVTPFQYPIYLIILFFAGRLVRRKTVVVAHNVTPHETSRFDRVLTELFFRSVAGVLVHSISEQQRAEELGAIAKYAPLPFHFPGEVRIRESREPIRELLFLGFVRPYKGLDLLYEALAKIDPPVRLTVAGEFWEPEAKYTKLASDLGIRDRVSIRNQYVSTKEMVDLLHAHDALVLPYRTATGSQLPQIAAACGVQTIVTPISATLTDSDPTYDIIVADDASAMSLSNAIISFYEKYPVLPVGKSHDSSTGWANYVKTLFDILMTHSEK